MTIQVNGKQYECKVHNIFDGTNNTIIELDIDIEEAIETFVDGAKIILIDEDSSRELTECNILKEITYKSNESVVVTYLELTDLEKLIQLHYGGVN